MIDTARPRRPLVFDAAKGTRLIARGLDLAADDPCLWNARHPEVVLDLHRSDVWAGADVIVTNTFGANRRWLARFGRDDAADLNRRGFALAREAAGPTRRVFGSVGPTAAGDPSALLGQVDALCDAGVEGILFETFTGPQAMNALQTLQGRVLPPVIMSLFDWPDPAAETLRRLEDLGVWAVGVNCLAGTSAVLRVLQRLTRGTSLPVYAAPSAGLPGDVLESPASFGRAAPALFAAGARMIGGCCGTAEAHVAAVASACYDLVVPESSREVPRA